MLSSYPFKQLNKFCKLRIYCKYYW